MFVPVYEWKNLPDTEKKRLLQRCEEDISRVVPDVQAILDAVRLNGDSALKEFNLRFDGVSPTMDLLIREDEFVKAEAALSTEIKKAIDYVIENVEKFHEIQVPCGMSFIEVRPGVLAGERFLPLDSAGIYVPRGKGSFPSMVYMLSIPAKLAGVKKLCLITPPLPDGNIDPACLYAAKRCGVDSVYRVGGAHGIAGLAFGTESLPKVDKILGPGNTYVTAAKRLLTGVVDTGLPAGPSESALLADENADPWKLALDLLVEAEHGADSSAFLAVPSMELALKVQGLVQELIEQTPEPRKDYLIKSFQKYGAILVFDDLTEAVNWVNDFAPEHLSIQTAEPFSLLSKIRHAGEILLGEHLPFSAANYATGPNAVLPTGGKARTFGPVSVRDFMKSSSIVSLTRTGFQNVSRAVIDLADYEGFPSHARALRRRYEV